MVRARHTLDRERHREVPPVGSRSEGTVRSAKIALSLPGGVLYALLKLPPVPVLLTIAVPPSTSTGPRLKMKATGASPRA